MSTALEGFEAGLRSHFEHLAAAKTGTGNPVFALEHNLTPEALAEMRGHLYADLRRRAMCPDLKHCWIVHTAEHGYTFEGQEFWQTFAALTPGWEYLGDRWNLRSWFTEFAKRYNGVRPVGRWSTHFSFIAWPVTNALLPSDLQAQLAHLLFDLRYRLGELILLQYEAAGKMVAREAQIPSSRFRHFLEQHELVGRLVRALLEGEPEETVIYRPTLQRITDDLDAKHDAKIWIKETRREYAQFRAKLAPANPVYSLARLPDAGNEEVVDATTEMQRRGVLLLPRLQLRRIAAERWEAVMLIPSFQPLVNAKPKFREHLAQARYRIAAHGSSLYPGLSLISGRPVPRRLQAWPHERAPLIEFTREDRLFDAIVNTECQLTPAKVWVFHRAESDGYAVHIQGQHMRPGQEYIVVSRDPTLTTGLGEPVTLQCDGVTAVRLRLPEVTSAALVKLLQAANIGLHSKVEVEPVGLRPRQWTDEGAGEWLSTERPLLALTCDHEHTGFDIRIDSQAAQFIKSNPQGPTLVSLRDLRVGRHEVTVTAVVIQQDAFGQRSRHVARSTLTISIRHPTTWSPQTQMPSAMIAETVPAVPTLEDLLRRRLQLRVDGEDSRKVRCGVLLVSPSDGGEALLPIVEHALPLAGFSWDDALTAFIKKCDEVQLVTASSVYLVVDGGDLGERRILLEHDPEPVRWAQRKGKPPRLLLVNEGVQESIRVNYFNVDHPLLAKELSEDQAAQGIALQGADGLYVARWLDQTASIIVAHAERLTGLHALGAQIDHAELSKGVAPEQLLEASRLWRNARASGYMAELKQHSVLTTLNNHLLGKLCGALWVRQERALNADPSKAAHWSALEQAVEPPTFAYAIAKAWREHGADPGFDPPGQFRDTARSFARSCNVRHDPVECEFIWRVAVDPGGIEQTDFLGQLAARRHFSSWLKAARLLWLCQNLKRQDV
jgi:hypothetical protein